jgi:hypothetical protein
LTSSRAALKAPLPNTQLKLIGAGARQVDACLQSPGSFCMNSLNQILANNGKFCRSSIFRKIIVMDNMKENNVVNWFVKTNKTEMKEGKR